MIAGASPEKQARLSCSPQKRKVSVLTLGESQKAKLIKPVKTLEDLQSRDDWFSFIPNCSELLSTLVRLDLSNSSLVQLPESLNLLRSLEHLAVDKNQLSSLSSDIGEVRSLKSLSLSDNKISEVPKSLENLTNLEILNLSCNDLVELPVSIASLNRLRELSIANNKFIALPECVGQGMRNLQLLDLSNNPLRSILPPASRKIRRFIAKDIKRCRIFPNWMLSSTFWNLDEVILDGSVFVKFLFREKSMSYLRSLSMVSCSLKDSVLQKITAEMVALEVFNVGNKKSERREHKPNVFCFLPGLDVKNPEIIKEVNVHATGLPMVPHSIDNFCNLRSLNLGGNNIFWLPQEICNLQKLELLYIDNCRLSSLPENLGALTALTELVACENRFTRLPASMVDLKNLRILDLYQNQLSEMPAVANVENLQCFDIEMNLFQTKNHSVRNVPYETLRERLRAHYNCQRQVGVIPEPREVFYYEEHKQPDNYKETDCEGFVREMSKSCSMENWNSSEDSADEYEPNREAKSKLPRPRSLYQFHVSCCSYFRPADSHSRRVRELVKRMHKHGMKSMYTFENGQFEDP